MLYYSMRAAAVCQCRSSFLAFSIAINQGTGDRQAESTPLLWLRGIPTVLRIGARRRQIRTGDLILSGYVCETGKVNKSLGGLKIIPLFCNIALYANTVGFVQFSIILPVSFFFPARMKIQ